MLFDNTSLEIEKGERVAVIGAVFRSDFCFAVTCFSGSCHILIICSDTSTESSSGLLVTTSHEGLIGTLACLAETVV